MVRGEERIIEHYVMLRRRRREVSLEAAGGGMRLEGRDHDMLDEGTGKDGRRVEADEYQGIWADTGIGHQSELPRTRSSSCTLHMLPPPGV